MLWYLRKRFVENPPLLHSYDPTLRTRGGLPQCGYSTGEESTARGVGKGGGGVWACLPGACTLLLLVTTMVGVAAALRLLMLTRRDLDSLHARIAAG
ncbi:hypothetical protein Pmani_006172 [Petrolisthes manimaculis]|uniref:Uncharacterized protein n=1 Tax=Petrolisthes manimaculis TaxID=1843537 RepID=A0AAE1QDG2_9EUCA|nr:hypothetical protein Pmani_006172 [Petrolisthes manimaculis]